jgi:hypothetical protein
VGDTGTGKTTACQLAAAVRGQRLHIHNCNLYTEASDFLGGFRPARRAPRAARVSSPAYHRVLAQRAGILSASSSPLQQGGAGELSTFMFRRAGWSRNGESALLLLSMCGLCESPGRDRERNVARLEAAVAAVAASPLLRRYGVAPPPPLAASAGPELAAASAAAGAAVAEAAQRAEQAGDAEALAGAGGRSAAPVWGLADSYTCRVVERCGVSPVPAHRTCRPSSLKGTVSMVR